MREFAVESAMTIISATNSIVVRSTSKLFFSLANAQPSAVVNAIIRLNFKPGLGAWRHPQTFSQTALFDKLPNFI